MVEDNGIKIQTCQECENCWSCSKRFDNRNMQNYCVEFEKVEEENVNSLS